MNIFVCMLWRLSDAGATQRADRDLCGDADDNRERSGVHRKPDETAENSLHVSMWAGEKKYIWVFVVILSDISIDVLVFDSDFTRLLSLFKFKVHYVIRGPVDFNPCR